MNSGLKMRKGLTVLLLLGMDAAVSAQSLARGARGVTLSSSQASVRPADASQIVREIDDPHLGTRWVLMRNPDHPGGPGRLVMISETRTPNRQGRLGGPVSVLTVEAPQPVIRAGERLVVEENSKVIEARLQGVALNPAPMGSILDVRLSIGGKVVRVVALGPGRAVLQPESAVRP